MNKASFITKGIVLLLLICTLFLLLGCTKVPEGSIEQLYVAAVDAYSENELEIAYDYVSEIERLDASFFQASFLKSKILFFEEKYKESKTVLQQLIKKHPEFTEARIWLIRCLILLEEYVDAQTLLDAELSFNQTDWRVYYQYALLAAHTNNFELRLSMSARADRALSDSARVYLDLAELWSVFESTDRAIYYLQKAETVRVNSSGIEELQHSLESVIQEDKE